VEIGWALRRKVWGRGYATEIGRAGLDHAFSVPGVEGIVAYTEVHNARPLPARVARRAGAKAVNAYRGRR
jgi:RimJ/RimL family protein N-acetyltransferase